MQLTRIIERCPSVKFVCRALLPDYRLTFPDILRIMEVGPQALNKLMASRYGAWSTTWTVVVSDRSTSKRGIGLRPRGAIAQFSELRSSERSEPSESLELSGKSIPTYTSVNTFTVSLLPMRNLPQDNLLILVVEPRELEPLTTSCMPLKRSTGYGAKGM